MRTTIERSSARRSTAGRLKASLAVLAVAAFGLLAVACSDVVDPDHAGPVDQATVPDREAGSAGAGDGSDPGNDGGPPAGGTDEWDHRTMVGAEPTEPGDAEATITADPEIAESPATEPTPAAGPERDDPGRVEVIAPQSRLGPGESVLCATVQIGLDAVTDGDSPAMGAQRELLTGGSATTTDRALGDLLSQIDDRRPLDGDLLRDALARCQELGYRA